MKSARSMIRLNETDLARGSSFGLWYHECSNTGGYNEYSSNSPVGGRQKIVGFWTMWSV